MLPDHILIVDDCPNLRTAFRIALESRGYRVTEAPNGRVALEMARIRLPGLILLDLMMPVLDGWQTIRALQSDPRTTAIPVIAVSAQDLRRESEQLASAGFCAYLEKPLRLALLLDAVEDALQPDRVPDPSRARAGKSAAASSDTDRYTTLMYRHRFRAMFA